MGYIPNTNEIVMFFHCQNCLRDKPNDMSPGDWARMEVGFTSIGLQVFCRRCQANILHVDFEGVRHPANLTAHLEKSEEGRPS